MREQAAETSRKRKRKMSNTAWVATVGAAAWLLCATGLFGAQKPQVPTVNANVGGCTADFVVQDGNQKPIYYASVSLTFRYGFFNVHKVSLQAYTDSSGRARFEGLPGTPKKPLEFHVQYRDSQKTVADNPENMCNASFTVTLE